MRLVLLAAVLAAACDQGAAAAPKPQEPALEIVATPPTPFVKYEVRDDEDFAAKAIVVIEELFAIFNDQSKDCEVIATRVEQFGARNVTRFAVLTAYGKTHPEAEKVLQKQLEPRMGELTQLMTPTLTQCMSNQRMVKAFEKLSQDVNAQQFQQRPR